MGKTIEVRLSDAQHAQLSAEAEASGQTFFGYCRAKLAAPIEIASGGTAEACPTHIVSLPQSTEHDRLSRIEAAVAALTDHVLQGQTLPEPVARAQSAEPFDVDSLVNAQFAEAEAQGLTEHVPDAVEEVMNVAGMRPLSRRPIPYSPNTAPRHLQQL